MDIRKQYPGRYLKAADIDEPTTFIIQRCYKERIGQAQDEKPILYFEGEDRGLVLNKTNSMFLGQQFGWETTDWKGKPIELYATQVPFGADIVDSIRLREAPPAFIDEDIPA
jgi:hypothetical protein